MNTYDVQEGIEPACSRFTPLVRHSLLLGVALVLTACSLLSWPAQAAETTETQNLERTSP